MHPPQVLHQDGPAEFSLREERGQMIVEGVKLTFLGIGVVYLFLSLLVVVIKLSSRVLRPWTTREEAAYQAVPVKKVGNRRAEDEQQRVLVVINAAIAAHRARKAAAERLIGAIPPSSEVSPPVVQRSTCPPSQPTQCSGTRKRTFSGPGALFLKDRSSLQGYFQKR